VSRDKHPTTLHEAWQDLWDTLESESVCYPAGMVPGAELRPLADSGMNYGEAVSHAVENLQQSGGVLTRNQILAIANLCSWVARAARH
jgi:hypothetical protein